MGAESRNARLKEAALAAVRAYHADSGVSMQTTKEGLEEILSETQSLLDAVESDLRSQDQPPPP